ncbi:MAG: HAD family hydrolase [Patescibacteria group bacterium]|nr:HAD family hydrolase [Patescibacteria group bacterium]
MKNSVIRVAMWSGPRNCSTALMYSWGNRPDTVVWDEPFYAHYLKKNKRAYKEHPMSAVIMNNNETDEDLIIKKLAQDMLPEGKSVFFQKHMSHHLMDGMRRDWLRNVQNCFLIRDPFEVILSLSQKLSNIKLQDTGFEDQYRLFRYVCDTTGSIPIVIDHKDLLTNPEIMLRNLCRRFHVDFDESMLSWESGPKKFDGIWASYWYGNAWKSTGFIAYKQRKGSIPEYLEPIYRKSLGLYEELFKHRLIPS